MAPITARQSGWVQLDTFEGPGWFQVVLIAGVVRPSETSTQAQLLIESQQGRITVTQNVEEVMDRIERARRVT